MHKNSKYTPIISIGASTGGVDALLCILSDFPRMCPPTVVVQHMRPAFIDGFAQRLNKMCAPDVLVAQNGSELEWGKVLIAPGDKQMEVIVGKTIKCLISDGDTINGHAPSVDVLFKSVAKLERPKIGVILTGMGKDGAKGMRDIRRSGGMTLAQDEGSSVVFGMPKAAIELNAAELVLPIKNMSGTILSLLDNVCYPKRGRSN